MKITKRAKDLLKPRMPKVVIDKSKHVYWCFTDGSCDDNKTRINTGSWGYVIVGIDEKIGEHIIHYDAGKLENTTNNIGELLGVINCLEYLVKTLPKNAQVIIHSDSQYIVHGYNSWSKGWIARNWHDVKNADLWRKLLTLALQIPDISVKWVAAHQLDPLRARKGNNTPFETRWNDYVDKLCTEAVTGKREEDKPVYKPSTEIIMRTENKQGEDQIINFPATTKKLVYSHGLSVPEIEPVHVVDDIALKLQEVTKDLVEAESIMKALYLLLRRLHGEMTLYEDEDYSKLVKYLIRKGNML